MHWFVTGSRGQLGSALLEQLARDGADASGADIDDFDVADEGAVRDRHRALPRPLVWVNGAGFTQVDRCEREPELARRANSRAPAVLARACAEAGARFVHVSTDYVFSGDAKRPYREDDPTGPRSCTEHQARRRSRRARGLARVPRRAHELGVRQGPQLHRRGAGAGRGAARRQRLRAAARGRRSARAADLRRRPRRRDRAARRSGRAAW
jgi:hypothetical protein